MRSGPTAESTDDTASTAELAERALRQAGALVRAEASLATSELRSIASGALFVTAAALVSAGLLTLALVLLVAAVLTLLGASIIVTLFGCAAVLAVLGVASALVAKRRTPSGILERTQNRIANEARHISDHAP